MKFNWKSIFSKKETTKVELSEIDGDAYYDQYADWYYTNIVNSLILFTYDAEKLEAMAYVLIDPLTELYEELQYACIPVPFNTVFGSGLISESLRNDILNFKT